MSLSPRLACALAFIFVPAAQPARADLISYWNFDEPSGSALDPTSGNNGTLGSGATRVGGLIGSGAIGFDDTTNAFVNVGSGGAGNTFSTTTGISIEALIVPQWNGTGYDEIFRKEDGGDRILLSFQNDANNGGASPAVAPGPVLSFGLNIGGAYNELDMPLDGLLGRPTLAALEDGGTHHVVATYDSATGLKALYIDGVLTFSTTTAGFIQSGGGVDAIIGNLSSLGEPFTGTIDEVAFYNNALSASEIAQHFGNVQLGANYFAAVPEPSSVVLLAMGGVAAGWYARRRTKRATQPAKLA